jgi:Ca2+-binding EF-hand superfamily protein
MSSLAFAKGFNRKMARSESGVGWHQPDAMLPSTHRDLVSGVLSLEQHNRELAEMNARLQAQLQAARVHNEELESSLENQVIKQAIEARQMARSASFSNPARPMSTTGAVRAMEHGDASAASAASAASDTSKAAQVAAAVATGPWGREARGEWRYASGLPLGDTLSDAHRGCASGMLNDPEAKHSEAAVLGAGGYQAQQAAHDPHDDSVDSSAPRNGDGGRSRTPDHTPEPALRGNVEISWHVDESPRGSGSSAVSTDGGWWVAGQPPCLYEASLTSRSPPRGRISGSMTNPCLYEASLSPGTGTTSGTASGVPLAGGNYSNRWRWRPTSDAHDAVDVPPGRAKRSAPSVDVHRHRTPPPTSNATPRSPRGSLGAATSLLAQQLRERAQVGAAPEAAPLELTPAQKASVAGVIGQLKMALAKNLHRIIDTFREFDEDQSGKIDKREFRSALQKLGVVAHKSHYDLTFDSFDSDRSGALEYQELYAHLRRRVGVDPPHTIAIGAVGGAGAAMGRAASLQASPPSQHHRHPASPRSSSPCSLDSQGAATTRMPMRMPTSRSPPRGRISGSMTNPYVSSGSRLEHMASRGRMMATDGMPHQAKGWGVSWNFMPTPQSPTRGQILKPEADRSSRRQAPIECMHTTGLHAPAVGLGPNAHAPTVQASLETLVLEASHHLGAHVRTYMSTTPGGSGMQSHPLGQRVAMMWPRALVHFASTDELGTGRLTMAEFGHGLAMLGLVAKREEVQKLFNSFTADLNGTVSYRAIGSMLQKDAALLEKEALKRVLAGSLSRMNDRFRQFDADGSGTVDKLEFRKVIASILPATDEACDAIFDEFDEDCSGEIQYIEYIRASLRGALKTSFTRVIDLFRKWDTDENGTIERAELHACLRAVGFDAPADVVDELFAEMDVDGSGSVEYKELHRVLRQGQNSKLHPNLRPGAVDFAMYAENPQALRRSGSFDSAYSARQRGGFGFRLRRDASSPTRSLQPGAFDSAIGTYGLNQHALRRSGSFERTHVPTTEKQTSPNQAHNQAPSGPLKAVTIEGLRAALTANRTRVIDAFRMLDKDSDGTITKAEFRGALPLLGFDTSRTDLADELFMSLDSDGGGTIRFDELNRKLRQGAAVELAAELKAGAAGAIELKAKNKVAPGSLRRGQTRGEPDEPDKIAPGSSRRPLLSAQRSSIVLKEVTVAGVREALAASYSRVIDFFKRMDKNGDGAVTKHEFRAGLGLLGIEESQASMEAIDALFDSFDMDGSGELTFNELKTILRYEAAKLEKSEEIGDDRGDW